MPKNQAKPPEKQVRIPKEQYQYTVLLVGFEDGKPEKKDITGLEELCALKLGRFSSGSSILRPKEFRLIKRASLQAGLPVGRTKNFWLTDGRIAMVTRTK